MLDEQRRAFHHPDHAEDGGFPIIARQFAVPEASGDLRPLGAELLQKRQDRLTRVGKRDQRLPQVSKYDEAVRLAAGIEQVRLHLSRRNAFEVSEGLLEALRRLFYLVAAAASARLTVTSAYH